MAGDLFEKVGKVFTKEPVSKEEFGQDGYILLRLLSMKAEYTEAINQIQKYQGMLGHRLMPLLQAMFAKADKAPFLDYVKKGEQLKMFSPKVTDILKKLFNVSKSRLDEYVPNLWVTEEEVKETWGL